MPPSTALCVFKAPIQLNELAATIYGRHRAQLREVIIEVGLCGGVFLRGRARTFYGKQLAQHEVLRRGLVLLANEIVVYQREVKELRA